MREMGSIGRGFEAGELATTARWITLYIRFIETTDTLSRRRRELMSLLSRIMVVILLFPFGSPALTAKERSMEEARKIGQHVLGRAIIIDTHADTPQMMLDDGYDLADPNSPFMISIPKMQRGTSERSSSPSGWMSTGPHRTSFTVLSTSSTWSTSRWLEHADALELAQSADDIVRIHRAGKLAILMGVEGGHIIEGDLRMLDIYYRLGVRYMTLTHTKNTKWAIPPRTNLNGTGLTDFGRQVVERMNRRGMMVDISHVSDKTFYDVLATTKAPVIASHSSCRAISPQPRNMTDDMIQALARNGGVMDINFYSAFLDPAYASAHETLSKEVDAEVKAAREEQAQRGEASDLCAGK